MATSEIPNEQVSILKISSQTFWVLAAGKQTATHSCLVSHSSGQKPERSVFLSFGNDPHQLVRSDPLWSEQRKNRNQGCNLAASHSRFRFNSILACRNGLLLLTHSSVWVWVCISPKGRGPLTHVGRASFLRDLLDGRSQLSGAGDRLQADLCHRLVAEGRKRITFCFCSTVKQARRRSSYPYWTTPITGPVTPTLMV